MAPSYHSHCQWFTVIKQTTNDDASYSNEERIQLKLKGLNPIKYRNQSFE
ncbi:IS3 family transposase [Actinobacillus seminis]